MTEGVQPPVVGLESEFADTLALHPELGEFPNAPTAPFPDALTASGAAALASPQAVPPSGPPLLFQADTVDTVHWSEPGFEPHSSPRPVMDPIELDRAFGPVFDPTEIYRPLNRRSFSHGVTLAKLPAAGGLAADGPAVNGSAADGLAVNGSAADGQLSAQMADRVAALAPDPHAHLLDLTDPEPSSLAVVAVPSDAAVADGASVASGDAPVHVAPAEDVSWAAESISEVAAADGPPPVQPATALPPDPHAHLLDLSEDEPPAAALVDAVSEPVDGSGFTYPPPPGVPDPAFTYPPPVGTRPAFFELPDDDADPSLGGALPVPEVAASPFTASPSVLPPSAADAGDSAPAEAVTSRFHAMADPVVSSSPASAHALPAVDPTSETSVLPAVVLDASDRTFSADEPWGRSVRRSNSSSGYVDFEVPGAFPVGEIARQPNEAVGGIASDGVAVGGPALVDPVLADPVSADPVSADPVLANRVLADPAFADVATGAGASPTHSGPTGAEISAATEVIPAGGGSPTEPLAVVSRGRHRQDGPPTITSSRRLVKAAKGASDGAEKPPKRKAPWWELPVLVGLAIIIAVLVKNFVVQPFYIPSASMEKTLHGCPGCSGDRILVNKPIYDLRDPHPGDIVVFHAPNGWNTGEPVSKPPSNPVFRLVRGFGQLVGFVPPDGLVLVKRVIAVGGETVKGVSTDGGASEQIMISKHGDAGPWKTLTEKYVYLSGPDPSANFGPVTVPKGRLWVMGDHRNDSADSRYHCGPDATAITNLDRCDPVSSTVPISNVIGKAFVIAWPPSRWRTLGTPGTFENAAASGALPLGVVFPIFLVRRRRRRR